ncbi:MAG: lipopolysaccharide assembly protein LapB [Legionellales bacterium]|nr:lipopolysaccharide assembly protein LapB [Legionellales bacterium]
MFDALLIILPAAAISGWYYSKTKRRHRRQRKQSARWSKDYLAGLNYLLDEQPDKAVDVFIKMLEVDSETVETHLALGNLFRKRGEVDRAIRVHQNLIARPHLDKAERTQALLCLGQDYFKAGVFDRAERLFHEVIDAGAYLAEGLRYLLDIYEQEKDWDQAIQIAQKLGSVTNTNMNPVIAHYYCELAEEARLKVSSEQAARYLKRALSADRNSVRTSLLQGEWEAESQQYKAAIRAFKRVKDQDPDYIAEVIPHLVACYEKLGLETELIAFLRQCLDEVPRISIVLALTESLRHWRGAEAAIAFLTEQLQLRPTVRGLKHLIDLQLGLEEEISSKEKFQLLDDLIQQLLQDKPIYRCVHCGFSGKVLHWHCPSCKQWNVVKPIQGLEGE